MNFEIGEIPEGWERGEELRIRNAPRNGYGSISQCMRFLPPGTVPNNLIFITFHEDNIPKVNEWLKWWGENHEASIT